MEEKTVNKTNTNGYTFIFAIIMVLVVASVLAFTATSLKPLQNENVRNEKCKIFSPLLVSKPAEIVRKLYMINTLILTGPEGINFALAPRRIETKRRIKIKNTTSYFSKN